jgi:predicted GIY-YIG superfamily endonuclease
MASPFQLPSTRALFQAKDVHRSGAAFGAAKVDGRANSSPVRVVTANSAKILQVRHRSSCHSSSYRSRISPESSFVPRADGLQHSADVANSKCTVYVLKTGQAPVRYYTGVTSDVRARLAAHNAGRCPHSADARPWQLDVVIEFADERRALKFEQYLKSGSGCAFAKRHLR